MKNTIKKLIIIFSLFIIYTIICASSYAENLSSGIADSVFRLHVIANSDSQEDQNLKYKVRDNLLEYLNSISSNANSKEEIIKIVNEHKNDFYNVAISTIKENGFDYDVNINVGNFLFPTKTYGDISLPSGSYDGLRVEIGTASGKNWWCVMFPPLCFVDVSSGIVPDSSKETLQNNMSDEEYKIISDSTSEFKFKFKILELFQNAKVLTAQK